jgi:hypothetical protein
MLKSKRAEFIVLTIALLVTRAIDGVLTYLITPDLSREQNPLVKFFGAGWVGMLAIGAIVIIGMIVCLHWSIYSNVDNFPTSPNLTSPEYKQFYFDVKNNPNLQTNQGLRILAYVFAYSLPRATILWGLVIIFHNTLVYVEHPAYKSLRESFNIIPIYYMILPLLGFVFINRLLAMEYTRYKSRKGEQHEHAQ